MREFFKKRKNWIFLAIFIITIIVVGLIPKDFNNDTTISKSLIKKLIMEKNKNRNFKNLLKTDNKLDLAIIGDGYFRIKDIELDSYYYTRYGELDINDNRILGLKGKKNYILYPEIKIPQNCIKDYIIINDIGEVYCNDTLIGNIYIYKFENQIPLSFYKYNLYEELEKSGKQIRGNANQISFGSINQAYIEENIFDLEIIKIDYVYNLKSENKNNKIITKKGNNWFDESNERVDIIIANIVVEKILNLKYIEKIKIDNESLLKKWQIYTPNFIIKIYFQEIDITIIVGTDIERKGYYFISDEKKNYIYVIKEHEINSLRINLNKL